MNFPFLLIILGPLRGDGTNGSQVRIHKARGFLWGKVPLVYQMDGKKHIIFMGKKHHFHGVMSDYGTVCRVCLVKCR